MSNTRWMRHPKSLYTNIRHFDYLGPLVTLAADISRELGWAGVDHGFHTSILINAFDVGQREYAQCLRVQPLHYWRRRACRGQQTEPADHLEAGQA